MGTIGISLSKTLIVTCRNQDGTIAWREEIHNLTPNEALNNMLGIFWTAVSPPPVWYMLLIDTIGFTALAASDTASEINGTNGWEEFAGYLASTRPAVVWGAVAGESVDNSASPVSFTINTSATLQGAALVTSSGKSGIAGFLGGEGSFGSPQSVTPTQIIGVEVVATAASA